MRFGPLHRLYFSVVDHRGVLMTEQEEAAIILQPCSSFPPRNLSTADTILFPPAARVLRLTAPRSISTFLFWALLQHPERSARQAISEPRPAALEFFHIRVKKRGAASVTELHLHLQLICSTFIPGSSEPDKEQFYYRR